MDHAKCNRRADAGPADVDGEGGALPNVVPGVIGRATPEERGPDSLKMIAAAGGGDGIVKYSDDCHAGASLGAASPPWGTTSLPSSRRRSFASRWSHPGKLRGPGAFCCSFAATTRPAETSHGFPLLSASPSEGSIYDRESRCAVPPPHTLTLTSPSNHTAACSSQRPLPRRALPIPEQCMGLGLARPPSPCACPFRALGGRRRLAR